MVGTGLSSRKAARLVAAARPGATVVAAGGRCGTKLDVQIGITTATRSGKQQIAGARWHAHGVAGLAALSAGQAGHRHTVAQTVRRLGAGLSGGRGNTRVTAIVAGTIVSPHAVTIGGGCSQSAIVEAGRGGGADLTEVAAAGAGATLNLVTSQS